MNYEPAVGDVVTVVLPGAKADGDIGEVVDILPGAVGVRIVQGESEWHNQVIYFTRGQLAPVNMGR